MSWKAEEMIVEDEWLQGIGQYLKTSRIFPVVYCNCFSWITNYNSLFQFGKGKMAVMGSVHMFSDQYVEKEENSKIIVRTA